VPDFDLPASGGRRVRLAGLLGKPFVLYFYPKADTSGCTQEARDFQAALDAAGPKATPVLGISKDPLRAIDAFARKHELRFPLVSDETGALVEAFGVWVQKSMYGRSYMGIERSSFLIGADGRVAQAWRRVKVPGHAPEVMQQAQLLK
jgi:peroxiredoxin Q/BCP